jgi:hypothetical protein
MIDLGAGLLHQHFSKKKISVSLSGVRSLHFTTNHRLNLRPVSPQDPKRCCADHPSLGCLAPVYFLNIAEKTNVFNSIELLVIEEAFRQLGLWQSMNTSPKKMAINILPFQLLQPSFSTKIKYLLKETGLNPELLEFELTE